MYLNTRLCELELRELTNDEQLIRDVLHNSLYYHRYLIKEGSKILAASLARITSETTLLFGEGLNTFTRSKIIKKLMMEQTLASKTMGINQTHVWTHVNPELLTHLGFTERKEPSYILHF